SMMSLDPQRRYQNPAQLLDAVRDARREVGDKRQPAAAEPAPPEQATLFLLEKNQKLQEVLRDKIAELGYRVLVSADPAAAVARHQKKPYHALIADIGSTGADALSHVERILADARK